MATKRQASHSEKTSHLGAERTVLSNLRVG